MAIKKNNDVYSFSVKGKDIEVFLSQDNVEMYEVEDPGKTGFCFKDAKEFTLFCNNLCDIIEDFQAREKNV